MQRTRELGDGVLARGAAAVYQVLVLEVLLLIAAAPGIVLLVLLVPDTSNAPLVALALLPVAPALSATVFAWRAARTGSDLRPARHFRRGYRANVADVLWWWVPALCLMAVLVTNLAHLELAVRPAVARAAVATVLVVLLIATVLWSAHMLVLTSLFTLRTRDAARLGLYHLGRPRATLGAASVLVLAAGTVMVGSDWVLALLGSGFALLLLHNARPMIVDVEENHTA